jgi:hypothetical protein
MRKSLLLLALVLLGAVGFPAQGDNYAQSDNSAPVVWERYSVPVRKVSFLFPKMPMVRQTAGACGEIVSVTYLAYAEGIIYEVVLYGPRQSTTQINCGGKIVPFAPRKLDDRLAELRNMERYKELKTTVNGAQVDRFRWNKGSRWIFPNPDTPARWTEVAISHYPNNDPDVTKFLESFSFSSTDGKPIGEGSSVMLGDAGVKSSTAVIGNLLARTTTPLTLYWRPVWNLPSNIATTGVKGSVILEITFLANGSIGPIRVEKSLPNGITEAAIASARRICFLPKRVDGFQVDDKQMIEYKLGERN